MRAALKDPNDVADYELDWAPDLGTDTISTSTWIAPAGITVDSDTNTTTTATVWLSGGTHGQNYDVVNRISTAGQRQFDRSVRFYVRNR